MSKIDRRQWQNPFTEQGMPLAQGAGSGTFQLHEAGTLRLAPGWLHRGVCSPFWRLFYDFSPGVWVTCAGRRYEPDAAHLVIMPDGVPFDCGGRPGVEHLWLHFSLHLIMPAGVPGVLWLEAGGDFQVVAAALREAVRTRQGAAARHLGLALLHTAFARLEADWFKTPGRRMRRVLTWLEHNASGGVTNAKLAAQAGLGVEAFIRWFKAGTGRTPAAFVAEWRVREACRRLAYGDDSIEQIAEALGFSNRHHFSRVFKRHAGCGPATFRRGKTGA
jgi:AraC-like DNA-binding protein